jgi:hypothetical protein
LQPLHLSTDLLTHEATVPQHFCKKGKTLLSNYKKPPLHSSKRKTATIEKKPNRIDLEIEEEMKNCNGEVPSWRKPY